MTSRSRLVGFWAVTAVCVTAAIAYTVYGVRQQSGSSSSSVASAADSLADATRLAREPHVLFRHTAVDAGNGHMAVAALSDPNGTRRLTPLECERVDFAGGTGVCLTADRGVLTTYAAAVFDASFSRISATIPLKGIPSRVRVSPDGSVAAVTVFVAGHSYSGNDFSTETLLLDTRLGKTIADLEQFAVFRGGTPFKAADFNFWGVTFTADANAFFATLSSGGNFYLVKGDLGLRRVTVVGSGVECPSLSPDETRIAYKKRATEKGGVHWHLAVRVLATGEERVLTTETRSIDDQVEWLDDRRILYGTADSELGASASSIWVIDVDGGIPRKWLENGVSPAVPPARP